MPIARHSNCPPDTVVDNGSWSVFVGLFLFRCVLYYRLVSGM